MVEYDESIEQNNNAIVKKKDNKKMQTSQS